MNIGRFVGPNRVQSWNYEPMSSKPRKPSRRTVREIEQAMITVPAPFVADPAALRLIRGVLASSRRFATWRRTTINGQLFDDLALAAVGVGVVAGTAWAVVESVTS